MFWSDDDVFSLIKLVRERPILWDFRLEEHRDLNKKRIAFLEVALSFGVEREEVERKLKNLIIQYLRELKRKNKIGPYFNTIEESYESKWQYYEHMKFINERYQPTETTNSQDSSTSEEVDVTNVISCEKQTQGPFGAITQPLFAKTMKESLHDWSNEASSSGCQMAVSATDETYDVKRKTQELNTVQLKRDQQSLFAEQEGFQMREFPPRNARISVKRKIDNTFFDAETGTYNVLPTHNTGTYLYKKPGTLVVPFQAYANSSIPPPLISTRGNTLEEGKRTDVRYGQNLTHELFRTITQPTSARTAEEPATYSPYKVSGSRCEVEISALNQSNAVIGEKQWSKTALPKRDQFSLFGEQVAFKIHELPSPYAREVVKQKICNILYEAKLGRYNGPPALIPKTLPYVYPQPTTFFLPVQGVADSSIPASQEADISQLPSTSYLPQ